MIKIFNTYELETDGERLWKLNACIEDGYKLFAVVPAMYTDNGEGTDGYLILHKSTRAINDAHDDAKEDEAAAAPTRFVNHVQKQVAERRAEIEAGNYPNTLAGFKAMVRAGDYLVLDTETTGLSDGEICQIAIIDAGGQVLCDTLIKTVQPIPEGATYIHGITNDDVSQAPTWAEMQPAIRAYLKGRNVVIYNATYDRKMMHKSDERAGLSRVDYKLEATYWDAMLHYAEYRGEWNDYHGNYRWHKLTNAAKQCGIPTDNAHSALGDVLMTNGVIRHMAGLPPLNT